MNKPHKNFHDVMGREECQQWAEAFDNEYQGFYKHKTLKMVRPEQGVKIFGTTTQTKYKVDNWVLKKRKVRLCVMGNQQTEGIHYQIDELYEPVMKCMYGIRQAVRQWHVRIWKSMATLQSTARRPSS